MGDSFLLLRNLFWKRRVLLHNNFDILLLLFLYYFSSIRSYVFICPSFLLLSLHIHLFLKSSNFYLLFFSFSLFLFTVLFFFLTLSFEPIIFFLVKTSFKLLKKPFFLSISLFLPWMLFPLLLSHFLSCYIFYLVINEPQSILYFLFKILIIPLKILLNGIVLFCLIHIRCC